MRSMLVGTTIVAFFVCSTVAMAQDAKKAQNMGSVPARTVSYIWGLEPAG